MSDVHVSDIEGISPGAEVILLRDDWEAVGRGRVRHVGENETCHFVRLGNGRISVDVTEALHPSHALPYPTDEFGTIADSLSSVVLWDRSWVRLTNCCNMFSDIVMPDGMPGVQNRDSELVPFEGTIVSYEDISVAALLEPTQTEITMSLGTDHLDPLQRQNVSDHMRRGDDVDLYVGDLIVGRGEILKNRPHDVVDGIVLGSCRVGIHVIKAILPSSRLPYPNGTRDTIEASVGVTVIWDVADVTIALEPIDTTQNNNDDGPVHGEERDYGNRSKWYNLDVDIYFGEDKFVAEGTVTAWSSEASVNNEALGEDHVGVLVRKLICDEVVREEIFPTYTEGWACLVKWPIAALKLRLFNRFLGDFLHEKDQGEEVQFESQDKREEIKRPYNMGGERKPSDPNRRQKKRVAIRRESKGNEDSVLAVCTSKCGCGSDCCRTFPRRDVEELREEFYGLDPDGKKTQVWTYFENREASIVQRGKMVLRGRTICKKAFWTILGIGRTTFYEDQKKFTEGYKVGFHGNRGTKKPRIPTMEFRAQLEGLLRTLGEPMPHLRYTGEKGTSEIIYRLPSCYNKHEIYKEVVEIVKAEGLQEISQGTFYKLWRENFQNYSFHSKQAFAKCETCTTLKEVLMIEKNVDRRRFAEREREAHMKEQMSRRATYYAARVMAKKQPKEHLCLIHDKMDQGKTGIPKLLNTLKSMASGCKPLPIALTGMITHGWQPGVFAHFSLTGLWPGDPDFTITSLAKCLRDLESYSGDKSGDLHFSPMETTKPLFNALLNQHAFEQTYLKEKKISSDRYSGRGGGVSSSAANVLPESAIDPSASSPYKKLPKHLHLQMDNSAKDNKNQTMLAFCSELVLRGHFETVVMSFLMVGHTHEDIDAVFSRVSMRINHREVTTLLALMAEVWECEAINPVPFLIQEVADYKNYIKDFVKPVKGQSVPMAFRFSMKNNVPIFQSKEHINSTWKPAQGICIWKEDGTNSHHMFPRGEPTSKVPEPIYKRANDVLPYIKNYVGWLTKTWKDHTSQGYAERLPLIQYWSRIMELLKEPLMEDGMIYSLVDGFWPRTNHGTGYKADLGTFQETGWVVPPDIDELERELQEDIEEGEEAFVGPPSERERGHFVPLTDIECGAFVFIRPTEEFEKKKPGCFWMGRALTTVQRRGEANPGKFKLQWWQPKCRNASPNSEHERYEGCLEKVLTWELDNMQPEVWQEATSAFHFWKYRGKNASKGVKIPKNTIDALRTYLARVRYEEATNNR